MILLIIIIGVIALIWYNLHQAKIRTELINSIIEPGDDYFDISLVPSDRDKIGVSGKSTAFAVKPNTEVFFPESSNKNLYFLTGIEFNAQFDSKIKGRAGSALVGGALFGATGAVIGGTRGKKVKSVEKNSNALLHLTEITSKREIIIEITANTELVNMLKKNYMATDYDIDKVWKTDSVEKQTDLSDNTDDHIENVNKRLANLKSLLDQGLIEKTEFDAKKAQILGL